MINLKYISLNIRTKLFRPPVVDDYVRRGHLESLLEDGQKYPIILVSAPAGYGKSTQISHWAGQTGLPCVWISLDESHNELGVFLRHLEAGVKDWSPSTAEFLQKIISASDLPPANHIADAVSTNLDAEADKFILVFDDYHVIHDAAIHLFIESFLMRMPESLRIAIVTRRSPPIALGRLRSQNLVLDVRLQNLMFDRSATQALVKQTTGVDVDAETLDKLQEITEGWPTGLRMLLLALSGKTDIATYLKRFEGRVWQIQEYLVEEVIGRLPPNVAKHIGATAVPKRFSVDLCESLIATTENADVSGREIIELIRSRGLFCIPLDEQGEWFRYHHLFREMLLRQVKSQYSDAEIKNLHIKAAKWFDNDGQIEEAIQHYLHAGDLKLATNVIIRHKDRLLRNQEWRRLDRVLNMIPTEHVNRTIPLLVLQAWASVRMGRLSQFIDNARIAQELIDMEAGTNTVDDVILGQVNGIHATVASHWGDAKAILAATEKALEKLPPRHAFERTEAQMIRGVALQMTGDPVAGRDLLLNALEQSGGEIQHFRARILMGLCYVSWCNGDLREQLHYASKLLEDGQQRDNSVSVAHAQWFRGAVFYQRNNLDATADAVRSVAAEKWWPHHRPCSYCLQTMALVYAARGDHSRATELADDLIDRNIESRSSYHLADAHALQAELAFQRGDVATAMHWAQNFETGPLIAPWGPLVPALVAAKLLLFSEQADALQKAEEILKEHSVFFESINNIRYQIEALALRAVLCATYGDNNAGNKFLARAVTLAEPGGFIRLFVNIGPDIVPLLNRLELNEQELEYIGKILAGFASPPDHEQSGSAVAEMPKDSAGLLEALSKREREVLNLLARRLTNKEIGEQLFIAPETVKRHAHNIFEKLNVSDRRAARAKAIGLGLVSE